MVNQIGNIEESRDMAHPVAMRNTIHIVDV